MSIYKQFFFDFWNSIFQIYLFRQFDFNFIISNQMHLTKKQKTYIIFNSVFWGIIIAGVTLFGVSFRSVNVNNYGLLRSYYNDWIDERIHTSGLYYVGVGNYFVDFPSANVYKEGIKVNTTNKDMNVIQLTYTLVYRLNKQNIRQLYETYSTDYEPRIVSVINSFISNYFMGVGQQQSRVTLQTEIVKKINQDFGKQSLGQFVTIVGLWLDQINFFSKEAQYQSAFLQSSSYSQAYEEMEIELMKTNMQVNTLKNLLETQKADIALKAEQSIQNSYNSALGRLKYSEAIKRILLSRASNASQIFEYYNPVKITLS